MGQITLLHEHSIKRQNDHYKFLAAMHGIDLDKEKEGTESLKMPKNDLTFKDPSEYEHMTDEEKDELTARMKGGHMRAVQPSGFGK